MPLDVSADVVYFSPGVRTYCPDEDAALRLAAAHGFGFAAPSVPYRNGSLVALYRTLGAARYYTAHGGRHRSTHFIAHGALLRTVRASTTVWTLADALRAGWRLADAPAQRVGTP